MLAHPSIRPYPEAFLRLVYPAACALCRHMLEAAESGLCVSCRAGFENSAYEIGEACSAQRFEFLDSAWSLYPYESPAGEILSAVKFLRKEWLLGLFENALARLAPVIAAETAYNAVVPIPIERTRLFEREFNQAERIAARVSRHAGVPEKKILKKVRKTFSQSGLGKRERRVNLFQAFRLRNPAAAEGKNFLLIDDIFTTGATGEETARLLKSRGARQVDILTLARTESWKEAAR